MDTYVKAMEVGDRASAMVALSFSDAIRFQSGGKVNDALNQIRKDIGIYRKMNYPALLGVKVDLVLREALKPHVGQRVMAEVVPV